MNGKPTFVFKSSRIQIQLVTEMDRDGTGFLNGEYCFADGTFKRCPGFVTLSVYVYVSLLRKMIKLATMEAKSENTENWLIFWNLLNQVISSFLSRKEKFNPIGWCINEGNKTQDG